MLTRIITALVGLVVFFGAFIANEVVFSLAVAVVSAIMVYETVNDLKVGKVITIISVFACILLQVPAIFIEGISPLSGNYLAFALVVMVLKYLIMLARLITARANTGLSVKKIKFIPGISSRSLMLRQVHKDL